MKTQNRKWALALVFGMMAALGAYGCSDDAVALDDDDAGSNARPGTSSGQSNTSSGQTGTSSGQSNTSSGQTGTSSGQSNTSSGEPGSSSGEPGSSSGQTGSSSGNTPANCTAITIVDNELVPMYVDDDGNVVPAFGGDFAPAVDAKLNNYIDFWYDGETFPVNTVENFSYGHDSTWLYTTSFNEQNDASPAIFEVESGTVKVLSFDNQTGDFSAELNNIVLVESTWDDDGVPSRVTNGRCLSIASAAVEFVAPVE